MFARRCFHFAYPTPGRKARKRHPSHLRDTEAAACIRDALAERGYRYGGVIFNEPSDGPALIPVDESFLRETDLILMTTRPPMDDHLLGNRRSIPRSYTTLEEKLFQGPLRQRFARCARPEILLTPATAAIDPEIARRQTIEFRQNGGAMYQSYGSPITRNWEHFKREHALTAAFLVYAEHAWPGGPAFLAAFGIGGTETLVWCYQLVRRFPHLLCTKSFAMAEMRAAPLPERLHLMDFADAWETTILGVDEPAPELGPQQAA